VHRPRNRDRNWGAISHHLKPLGKPSAENRESGSLNAEAVGGKTSIALYGLGGGGEKEVAPKSI